MLVERLLFGSLSRFEFVNDVQELRHEAMFREEFGTRGYGPERIRPQSRVAQ